jgi:hypothetical protein
MITLHVLGNSENQKGPLVPAKMEWKKCYGIKQKVGIHRYMSRKIDIKDNGNLITSRAGLRQQMVQKAVEVSTEFVSWQSNPHP